jgi:hypothetical protein
MKSLLAIIMVAVALCTGGCEPASAQGKPDAATPKPNAASGAKASGSEPEPALVVVIVSQGSPAAVEAIARARCDREQRCSKIGRGKKYASEPACLHAIAADWSDDLNAYECPQGVRLPELDSCLAAVRTEDCGKPFDSLARVLACRSSELCKKSK